MPIAQKATPPRKPVCLPTIWANEPITRPPTALPTSKNIVNELIAIARSRSLARLIVSAISDG